MNFSSDSVTSVLSVAKAMRFFELNNAVETGKIFMKTLSTGVGNRHEITR
jgi:hypothetical protein